jgi:outer membrane protein assembly factor BamB
MPRDLQVLIYVGIKNSVIALDDRTGAEVWRTKLAGSDFVTVVWDGEGLYAANAGEIFRLDPRTGALVWNNTMKGLGRGMVTIASSRVPTQSTDVGAQAAKRRRDAEAAAAAAR